MTAKKTAGKGSAASAKKGPAKKTTSKTAVSKKKPVAKAKNVSTRKNAKTSKTKAKKVSPRDKKPVGRPTDYLPEYCDLAFKYSLLGATDKTLADFFGKSESTINLWKKEHPDFSESISRGKDKADAEVAASLFKRAVGFTHKVEKPLVISVGNFQSEIKIAKYNETVIADSNAAYKWLHNRQAKLWPDKQNVDLGNLPAIGILLDLPEGYVQENAKDSHDGDGSGE